MVAKANVKGGRAKVAPPASDETAHGWMKDAARVLLFLAAGTSIIPAFVEGSTDVGRSAAVLCVASAWLVLWALGGVRFARQQVSWLAGLGVVVASVLASALLARFPLSELLGGLGTGMGAVQWIALVVIAAAASSVPLQSRSRRWIAAIYLWVVPVAAYGLVQALTAQPVKAGFLNADLFGLVLVVWLAPAFGLAITSRARWERRAWVALGVLILCAILASRARAASGAALAEVGLMTALVAPVAWPRFATGLRALGLALCAVISGVMVAVFAVGAAGLGASRGLVSALGPTLETRFLIYQGGLRTFATAPILGAGPDGYQLAAQPYIQPALMAIERGGSFVDTTPADPHSFAIRALVGIGGIGVIALVAAVAGWTMAVRHNDPQTAAAGALRTSFAIAVAGFALAALFGPWPLTIGASPAVVIGLAASASPRDGALPNGPTALRWALAASLAGVMLWVAVAGAVQYTHFFRAVNASSSHDREVALGDAVAATPYDEKSRFQRLWVMGVAVEQDGADPVAFHRAVDADPLVSAYAPFLTEFARQSLSQAANTNRADLSWERATLDKAAALAPGIPDVWAEKLHLALVSGDRGQVASALKDAHGRAEADSNFAAYATQASQFAPAP